MIINRKNIAKYSNLPVNYQFDEVMNYVDVAEKVWIINLIGNAQYDELCEQVKNNNLTPENATLLVEAIWPLLGFCITYEALPAIAYHMSEVSLTKGHSDNSTAIDLKELAYYQEHLKRQIQARGDYAIQWIKDRIEYYPLIAQCQGCKCSCCDDKELYKKRTFQQLYSPYRRCTNLK